MNLLRFFARNNPLSLLGQFLHCMSMKLCYISFLLLLIPELSCGQSINEIKFRWEAAESDKRKFDKAIMLIPVKFEADTTTCFLQFDTGATHSYLYINRINFDFPDDRIFKTSIGKIKFNYTKSIQASTKKNASVGTLGADFLQDKIIRIDLAEETINFGASYNPSNYIMEPLLTLDGRPVVKLNFRGKEQKLLYDTGSSLFGVWTNRKNWKRLREKSDDVKTFPISSWGKMNDGYYSLLDKKYLQSWEDSINDVDLQIWYVENKNFRKFFRENGLFGVIGNQFFLDKEVILDYKEGWFGFRTVPP